MFTWAEFARMLVDRLLLLCTGIGVAWFTMRYIERRRIDHQVSLELGKLRAHAMARQLQLARACYGVVQRLIAESRELTPEQKAAPKAPDDLQQVIDSLKLLQQEVLSTHSKDLSILEPEVSDIFKRIGEEMRSMPRMTAEKIPDATLLDSHVQRMKPLWASLLKYFPRLRLPD